MAQQTLSNWISAAVPQPGALYQKPLWGWICESTRRHLLASTLYKPLTSHQLCLLCQEHNPSVRTQDVHALLVEMRARGLVDSINNRARRGRLWYFSELGLQVLRSEAGLVREPLDEEMDWDLFGKVLCGRLRQALLTELAQPKLTWWAATTPTGLRKNLLKQHPSGISTVSKTLHRLEDEGLVITKGYKEGTRQRLYALSESGQRVLHWLNR